MKLGVFVAGSGDLQLSVLTSPANRWASPGRRELAELHALTPALRLAVEGTSDSPARGARFPSQVSSQVSPSPAGASRRKRGNANGPTKPLGGSCRIVASRGES